MSGSRIPYFLLLLALLALNAMIFLTPYLASQGDPAADALYLVFSPTCHQLTSRSVCLLKSNADGSLGIGDCFPESGLSPSRTVIVQYPGTTGYKLPVCSRDVAIYLFMLLGTLALPFLQKIGGEDWPNKWLLVAAAIPTAIDGGTQLLGFRESTNLIRIITGAIIGFALPFYIVPMLNSLYSFAAEKLQEAKKKGKKRKQANSRTASRQSPRRRAAR